MLNRQLLTILWYYGRQRVSRQWWVGTDQSGRARSQLLNWQDRQVQRFLRQVLPKSPFYRDYYRGLAIEDWQRFPVINKAIMMANFDQLNTVGIHKAAAWELAQQAEESRDFRATLNGYTVGMSSGTSGQRGLFVVSPAEQAAWAGTVLAKALPKPIWVKQRIAFFLRANSALYETVQQQRVQFRYFDLMHPVADHITELGLYQPEIVVAPPSLLRLLAAAQQRGELRIAPIKIVSVAEVLDPLDEQYIQTVFEQPVHQLYQCTEGFLGATCAYGTLHLNEDIIAIQKDYLDETRTKFMPIITDFRRQTQPIIRYRLDDILTERPSPCPCGSPMLALASVEGRRDDIFYLLGVKTAALVPVFPDFIRRAILLASSEIAEYRVVQVQPDLIEISLLLGNDGDGDQSDCDRTEAVQTKVLDQFKILWARLQVRVPQMTFSPYRPPTRHDLKLRRVENRCGHNRLS